MTRLIAALYGLIAVFVVAPAQADDYRLQVGDTLEISIQSVSITRRMTVDLDGKISVPLIGEIIAKEKTISELANYLRQEISAKSVNSRTVEGRDQVLVVDPQDISIAIADYVPIYVNGDVSHPGEQKFRPGLTVRQAIALAGGLDVVRFRVDNPTIASVDTEDALHRNWIDLEAAYVRRSILYSILGRTEQLNAEAKAQTPLKPGDRAQVSKAEIDGLRATDDSYRSQRTAIEKRISVIDDGIKALVEQKRTEDENLQFDNSEVQRINDLYNRGTVPATRLAETRRLALVSATRALQVGSQVESYKRVRIEAEEALQRLVGERNEHLMQNIKETVGSIKKLEFETISLNEKLFYTSALRSQLIGSSENVPKIKLVRQASGVLVALASELDTALQPGDVVEIRLVLYSTNRPSSRSSSE